EYIVRSWQQQIAEQLTGAQRSEESGHSTDEMAPEGSPRDYFHAKVNADSATPLHPLLHTNTSTLSQQSYSSILTGAEFFLKDHQLVTNGHAGKKVLPEAAYLEMARTAIEPTAG